MDGEVEKRGRPGREGREELWNTLTHGVGVLAALAGGVLLITLASLTGDPWRIVGAAVFTATLVLQLWEEGMVDLDSPFNDYLQLDEATHPKIPLFENVLVRHLLSHRSGVPYISSTTFFDVYGYETPIEQSEKIRVLFTEGEPVFEPGTEYSYSNSNFTILGLLIEAVTGMQYHEALRERICSRIGLTTTGVLDYDIPGDDRRFAHGYFHDFDGTDYHGTHGWASGGLVSNVRELTLFMRALVDGRLFQDPSTFDLMVTPVAGGHYGMGMFVTQTPRGVSYGHGGAVFGYNTKLEYHPELDVIVAANLTFNGIDFVILNWMDDFYMPVLAEVQRALDR